MISEEKVLRAYRRPLHGISSADTVKQRELKSEGKVTERKGREEDRKKRERNIEERENGEKRVGKKWNSPWAR